MWHLWIINFGHMVGPNCLPGGGNIHRRQRRRSEAMTEKRIPRNAFVLDVGSGDHPHRRADVLCDRYLDTSQLSRRHGAIVIDRPFVVADAIALPFADKVFDYVICSSMIEQVDDAGQALEELSRVGKAGYLSTYTEIHEFLSPYRANRWVGALQNGVLVLKRKSNLHELGSKQLYGGLFWALHLDNHFKRFILDHAGLFWVEIEWKDRINYRLVSESDELHDYHRASDIAALTRHTPAKGLTGKLRRFLRVSLTDAAWSSSMVFRINRSISRLISRGSIRGRGARQSSVR
jgi:SAM-dependent methyltransferase